MHRLYSFVLILPLLLTGCVASANVQSKEPQPADSGAAATAMPKQANPPAPINTEAISQDSPATCPVTGAPETAFVPPEPFPAAPPERYENQFWYGTPELWTMLGTDATWYALPQDKNGYSQKVFWWSQSFDTKVDPFPAFTVTLEQLDTGASSAPIVAAEQATNASADFGTAMLTGIEIPSLGCWKVTGQYSGAELSFLVWVAP
jgi:hypothetical protein